MQGRDIRAKIFLSQTYPFKHVVDMSEDSEARNFVSSAPLRRQAMTNISLNISSSSDSTMIFNLKLILFSFPNSLYQFESSNRPVVM